MENAIEIFELALKIKQIIYMMLQCIITILFLFFIHFNSNWAKTLNNKYI